MTQHRFDSRLEGVVLRLGNICSQWRRVEDVWHELRRIGEEAYRIAGNQGMTDAYDEAQERFGWAGVRGASGAWDGIGEWRA